MTRPSTMTMPMVLLVTAAVLGCDTRSNAETNEIDRLAHGLTKPEPTTTRPVAARDRVIVYYFHGRRRCRTCLGIQQGIEKTIRERFGAQTASGALSFQDVNLEEPKNKHFVKKYSISFSTMVVVANKGKATVKWENCDKVWQHAHNPKALTDYVDKRIRAHLALIKRR